MGLLRHPVDESIDALAYCTAWHLTATSTTHVAQCDKDLVALNIPSLSAARPAHFEDTLHFTQNLFHGVHGFLVKAVMRKASLPAAPASLSTNMTEEAFAQYDYVQYNALKLLIESAVDIVALLSSAENTSLPVTPPLASTDSSQVSSPSKALQGGGTPPPRPFRTVRGDSANVRDASSGASSSTTMEKLVTPHTLIRLMACAMLDSVATIAFPPLAADDENDDARASMIFFDFSALIASDPDELLTWFLEFHRVVPAQIRRLWDDSKGAEDVQLTRLSSAGRRLVPTPPNDAQLTQRPLLQAVWAQSSRKLTLQRSVIGQLLQTAGATDSEGNSEFAQLWRYVASY